MVVSELERAVCKQKKYGKANICVSRTCQVECRVFPPIILLLDNLWAIIDGDKFLRSVKPISSFGRGAVISGNLQRYGIARSPDVPVVARSRQVRI